MVSRQEGERQRSLAAAERVFRSTISAGEYNESNLRASFSALQGFLLSECKGPHSEQRVVFRRLGELASEAALYAGRNGDRWTKRGFDAASDGYRKLGTPSEEAIEANGK